MGQVDPLDAAREAREERQHAAGARAEIDHEVKGASASGGEHGLLDLGVGVVQRAQLVPVFGDAPEIGVGGGDTLAFHFAQAGEVALDFRVGGINPGDQPVDEGARPPFPRQAIEDPCAFGQAFDQAGAGEEFEVARQAGLALVQDLRKLAHGQLAVR